MSGNQMILLGGSQAPAVDPFFYSVTSLLHGDGTNGGQNNTFLDSSTNNFTITRNGNTTQGSFSPFSQTGWGNYFDGTGDYLIITSGLTNQFHPGSAYTFEGFFYINDTADEAPFYVGGSTVDWNASTGVLYQVYISGGTLYWQFNSGGAPVSMTTPAPAKDQWVHIAVGYNGTTTRMWVNGTSVATSTSSYTVPTYTAVSIGAQRNGGAPYTGYASNLRFVKGTDVYGAGNTSITVPTTPLTAITNTQLLTCQANRFLDASTNNFTITRNGDVSVQPFSPFNPTTPYSTSSIGGSGYFDGSGDYLTAPDNSALDLSGDFTVEAWVYLPNVSGEKCVFHNHTSDGNGIGLNVNSAAPRLLSGSGSWNVVLDSSIAISPNCWNHIAGTRSGNTYTIWVNGVSGGTATSSVTPSYSGGAQIGRFTSGVPLAFSGYMASPRVVKGTVVYTTAFTPPTAPLTAIANTSLLLNYTNGAIFDNAAVADYETVGNAQISTSVKKYGTGSMAFDGTGDYLVTDAPSTDLFAFGSGNFTIEFWVYFNSVSGFPVPYDGRASGANSTTPTIYLASGTIRYYVSAADRITGPTLSASTWYHVAICRVASQTKMFINGTQVGSTYADTTVYTNTVNRPTIGGDGNAPGSNGLNGYIDDLRISKGIGRYQYNFTPPTAEFPNIGGTVTLTADPYFDYTTLLLPGNGTNGAQNNTFLDSSTNNFTITRNGNTTQGTFSPFSQTGWGNYFDGNGDFLTVPSNAAFQFGTGDFTIECWVNKPAAANGPIVDARGGATASPYAFYVDASNFPYFYDGSSYTSAIAITNNQWNHIAVVRTSGVLKIFVNGVQGYSAAYTTALNPSATVYLGGQSFATTSYTVGYISNLRIVKGTAVYTSDFTPSTTPLTAITNTSLLTCQSNRFIDNSTNAFAITRNGDVSVQAFSPFNPTAAWSASTNGGSGYFDGSGDYLSAGDQTAFEFGSGDYTVEFWWYPTSSGDQNLIGKWDTGGTEWILQWRTAGYYRWASGGSVVSDSSTITLQLNSWNHVAVTKSGTSLRIYTNGAQINTTATEGTISATSTALTVGASQISTSPLNVTGYMTNVRILKGTAQYTGSTYTVPTAPLTAITNTSLLLNYTNAGIYDATSKNDLETVGNAQISTTQSKFGGSSMYFDGTDDGLRFYEILNTQFGTGDFTVEAWVYITSFSVPQVVVDARGSTTAAAPWQFYVNASNKVVFNYGSNLIGTISVAASTWTHIAATRYGSTLRIFVNGILDSSATTSASLNGVSGQPAYVGRVYDPPGSPYFSGYIDDLRITKGIARYTSNFTPPTTAFLTL